MLSDSAPAKEPKLNGIKAIFRSLNSRNYRLFFTGQTASLIGTWIQRLALPWLVYNLSGSAVLLGIMGFAEQIPIFLLGPVSGVVSDRFNKYKILLITQILSMFQALVLTIFYFTGIIEIWHIIVLGIFLGIINAFDMPSRQALLVEMVDKREDLGNAIALNSSMVNAARLVGPSIAGILIAATNEGICFLINGISYLFVIISLLMMKIPPKKIQTAKTKVLQGFKDGFSYAFGSKPIRSIILLLGLVSLMGMPYAVLMPVFVKKVLHADSHVFGFLMGGSGVGALCGALYLASRKKVAGLEKLIPIFAATFGAGIVALSFSRIFIVSLILMLISGFGMIMNMASSNTIIQTIVDDDKRGRVMSFYSMAFIGTAPIGSLMAGSLAEIIGVTETMMIGGLCCILGAAIYASKLPGIIEAIRPVYQKLGIIEE